MSSLLYMYLSFAQYGALLKGTHILISIYSVQSFIHREMGMANVAIAIGTPCTSASGKLASSIGDDWWPSFVLSVAVG